MGQATELLHRIRGRRVFLEPEDTEALRAMNWSEAADAEAREMIGADEGIWPTKAGILDFYCTGLAEELSSQAAQNRRRAAELGRLEDLADEVRDHLDTIADADPDLARRLADRIYTERNPDAAGAGA